MFTTGNKLIYTSYFDRGVASAVYWFSTIPCVHTQGYSILAYCRTM